MPARSDLNGFLGTAKLAPDPVASRLTLDAQLGLYVVNDKFTRHVNRSGLLPVPVAGEDGEPCEIVKQHAASGGKVVYFRVARYGLLPLVPGVEAGDDNVAYLGGEVCVHAPAIAQDGVAYTYRVWGYYSYAYRVPVWIDSKGGLPMGSNVLDRTDPAENVIPAEAFIDPTKAKGIFRVAGDSLATLLKLRPKVPAAPTGEKDLFRPQPPLRP